MKVKLRKRRKPYPAAYLAHCKVWKTAEPFFVNPRGVLIHRVREAATHTFSSERGERVHHSVGFWCGNQATFYDRDGLYSDPPKDRLLCLWCEAKAVASGEKPADSLAGRHVHKGRCVPMRTCCDHLN